MDTEKKSSTWLIIAFSVCYLTGATALAVGLPQVVALFSLNGAYGFLGVLYAPLAASLIYFGIFVLWGIRSSKAVEQNASEKQAKRNLLFWILIILTMGISSVVAANMLWQYASNGAEVRALWYTSKEWLNLNAWWSLALASSSLAALVACIALLRWRRWGFHGLIVNGILGMSISPFFSGGISLGCLAFSAASLILGVFIWVVALRLGGANQIWRRLH